MAASQETQAKIYEIVEKVLRYLLSGNEVQDDTVLHRLIDCIKQNCNIVQGIAKSKLPQFVEKVSEDYEKFPSSTVVFSLQLAGWLGGSGEFYQHFKETIQQAFSKMSVQMQNKGITDVSILEAFYNSLSQLSLHSESLKWIITDNKIRDISMEGLDILKTTSSIFLEKAVIECLSAIVKKAELLETVGEKNTFAACVIERALQNYKCQQAVMEARPFVTASLQLIERLCTQSQMSVEILIKTHASFCEYIIQKIYTAQGVRLETVLTIIGALLEFEKVRNKTSGECYMLTYFALGIGDHLTRLCQEGNVCNAQKLALCCLKNDSLENEDLKLRCTTLLTQPIYFIFGEEMEPIVIPPHVLMAEMSTLMKCTDTICRCLDWRAIQVGFVVKLLRTTVIPDNGIIVQKVAACLIKNKTVQRKCLDFLLNDSTTLDHTVDVCHIATTETLLLLFKEPHNDSIIYTLCSKLMLKLLPTVFDNADSSSLISNLADTVQHHLSALQWELRDTTLEFLGIFIQQQRGIPHIVDWMLKQGLHTQVWHCVKDSESYVRATAIKTLSEILRCEPLWNGLVQSMDGGENEAVQVIMDIAETDTEAFARRSAVNFLFNFCKVKVNCGEVSDIVKVMETMLKVTNDFDWEVKIIGLEFVSFVLQHDLQKGLSVLTQNSQKAEIAVSDEGTKATSYIMGDSTALQFASALLQGLDDYDEKVCEKALNIASDLQSSLEAVIFKWENSGNDKDCKDSKGNHENGVGDRDILIIKKQKRNPAEKWTVPRLCGMMEVDIGILKDVTESATSLQKILDVVCTILNSDLTAYTSKVQEISAGMTDLFSLAEDILSSAGHEKDEENVVDCY